MEADETTPALPPEDKQPSSLKGKTRKIVIYTVLALSSVVILVEAYRSLTTGTPFSIETFDKVLDGIIKVIGA